MILQKENKILRRTAEIVADITSAGTKTLIERMAEAMFAEPDGVGIAAPQIGASCQIFLVAKDLSSLNSETKKARKKEHSVFINPIIKNLSQKKAKDIEGCLSVRGIYGEVTRPEKLTVEYYDEQGKKHIRGASGLLARIIQHEIDHLNGTLFIDKAKHIQQIPNPK